MSYGAGAAGFPPRNRAALALIFFMHMAMLPAWMRHRPAPMPETPEAATWLLRTVPALPPPTPSKPEAPSAPGYPRPRAGHLPPIADFFNSPLPPTAKSGAPAATPADPAPAAVPAAPTVPRLEDAHAPTTVQDAIREQKEADGGFALGLAKRQAGRIDRGLRNGKSGVPDEPDTPMGRFRRGLEAAHVDRSKSVHFDTYTSPDGTVIYRKRIGNGSICRRGGNISPLGMGRMAMGNEVADNIPCPSNVEWKKD
ncbi:hypothetical protein AB4Z32_00760 [Massilia sp. 2TAF26]|uniref:hypothetical protein n=1 Tax=Massilia sp. 2TAF26 TaxID=3233012 RepID=UPI003F9C7734